MDFPQIGGNHEPLQGSRNGSQAQPSSTGLSVHEAQEVMVLVLKLNLLLLDRVRWLNLFVAFCCLIPLKGGAQRKHAIVVRRDIILKLPRLRQNAQIPKSILRFWIRISRCSGPFVHFQSRMCRWPKASSDFGQ